MEKKSLGTILPLLRNITCKYNIAAVFNNITKIILMIDFGETPVHLSLPILSWKQFQKPKKLNIS